ncbi:hypothetical protein Leryth_024005 [Lithospermum erythrorhizon]|nr:hypothetical protein Leryth_024005 [Lithospermum erythrorhizon]
MDETTALIYRGINLARELEENLPNLILANQPEVLLSKCEEIVRVFSNVKERLVHSGHHQTTTAIDIIHGGGGRGVEQQAVAQEHNMNTTGGGFQEWLRINSTMQRSNSSAMELLDHGQHFGSPDLGDQSRIVHELEGLQASDGQILHPIPGPDSSRSTPLLSSQRQRRRPDDGDNNKTTIRVPAPQMGNTDVPPEDGFTWRKYGQKEILGAKFPRAYYRCTHQKLYNCPAKKQVQRLGDDPFTFEVTYRGEHQCYLSSTAPSIPPSSLEASQDMNIQAIDTAGGFHNNNLPIMPMQSASTITLGHWLSMNINTQSTGEETSTRGNFSTTSNNTNAVRQPSAVRYGSRDVVDYQNVADLADVMFNSGSSSNNSMDLIFSAMEENVSNWNTEERKD